MTTINITPEAREAASKEIRASADYLDGVPREYEPLGHFVQLAINAAVAELKIKLKDALSAQADSAANILAMQSEVEAHRAGAQKYAAQLQQIVDLLGISPTCHFTALISEVDELRKDKERLDWFQKAERGDLRIYRTANGPRWWFGCEYDYRNMCHDIRQAIDAAMKGNQ